MKSDQTFSILIWANPAKANASGHLPLYVRVTVAGRRAEISLKQKVSSQRWNAKTGFLRGSGEDARSVNHYLSQVKTELFRIYHQMELNHEFISADAIKLRFNGPKIAVKRSWTYLTIIISR